MAPPAPIHPVVLDANVLYPAPPRDLLLWCAEKELYRLQLSQDIWTKVVRNLVDIGPMTSEQAARLDAAIGAFLRRSDALVTGYESLIPALTNDPKDRHVLGTATELHGELPPERTRLQAQPQRGRLACGRGVAVTSVNHGPV
jgi:hypothetical protein